MFSTHFARRFCELRSEKGLTQQQIADAFDMSKNTVTSWERSERKPSVEMLEEIANFFNVSIDYLYGRTSVRDPYPASSEDPSKPESDEAHDKIMATLKETGLLDLLDAARKIGFRPQEDQPAAK